MAEEKVPQSEPVAATENKPRFGQRPGQRPGGRGSAGGRGRRPEREKDEFDQKMIDLARVTRVMAGGKRMRFRACIVVGDGKGRLGWALAKGADVSIAMNKAATKAKKNLVTVRSVNGTIPHVIKVKYKAAQILFKPARKGTGIKAGGAVRSVLELSGIQDISAKILGTNNKITNVHATFIALTSMKYGSSHDEAKEKVVIVESEAKKTVSKKA
jgi:small subunit ribosomal protein S5